MKKIKKSNPRRDFIKKSALSAGSFFIVPRFVLGGKDGQVRILQDGVEIENNIFPFDIEKHILKTDKVNI